jgi:hypothetical protein
MKGKILMIGAAALAFAPSFASAQTAPPGQGYINGSGYWHNTGPDPTQVGQPDKSCEDVGITPGGSGSAPGGGSPFTGEDSTSGTHYAGSAPQNMRNSVSVSQYDVACFNQLPPQ